VTADEIARDLERHYDALALELMATVRALRALGVHPTKPTADGYGGAPGRRPLSTSLAGRARSVLADGPMTTRQVRMALGADTKRVYDALSDSVRAGYVERSAGLWRLTELASASGCSASGGVEGSVG
jgi:hypothetical protein